jgi:hypothetical protein
MYIEAHDGDKRALNKFGRRHCRFLLKLEISFAALQGINFGLCIHTNLMKVKFHWKDFVNYLNSN